MRILDDDVQNIFDTFYGSTEPEKFKEARSEVSISEDVESNVFTEMFGIEKKEVELPAEPVPQGVAVAKLMSDFEVVASELVGKDVKKEAFIKAFVKVKNVSKALSFAGVTKTEYGRWLREDADFEVAVRGVVDFVADLLEDTALEMALSGNERVLIKMLEAYRPEKFSPKRAVDIRSEHNINVNSWSELARKALEVEKAKVVEIVDVDENEEEDVDV